MVYALILVEAMEVEAGHLVTTTEYATTLKMRITVRRIVVATTMEYVKLAEEKTSIHVSMIVDVTRMLSVNLTEGKLLVLAKIVPVAVGVILVVARTLVQEDGWGQGAVNTLRVHVTIQTVRFGLGQNVHVPLDKSALKGIAETRMKKIVYPPGALLGMTMLDAVYAQANILIMEWESASIMIVVMVNISHQCDV
jgi:hypothetical protein